MDHQMYFQMEGVDSNFLLTENHFHFCSVSPKEEVFVVALSLVAFLSLFPVDQIHSNRYYFGIYLYLFQFRYCFYHLVPSML